jgi:nucleoside-specific outer membrane channel protein Tsx
MTAIHLRRLRAACFFACATLAGTAVQAADWSDTALSWRSGERFREPFNSQNIGKHVFALTHASGYQYGSNFFNLDMLISDSKDPASLNQTDGAQEAYVVYRHTLDIGKLRGAPIAFGPVKGAGLTLGFDWNTKNDVGYNSRKQMLVAGPTLMWDVPGFLTTSIVLLRESNAPSGAFPPVSQVRGRYTYDLHPMLNLSWGIPLGALWSAEGYANFIGAKGRNETGFETGAETNIDLQFMFDAGAALGYRKRSFRVGLEYQYWNNKFGNTAATTGGRGYRAKTPMVRVAYHF